MLRLSLQSAQSMLGVDLSWPAVTGDPAQVREDHTVALVAEAGAPAVGEVGRGGVEGGQGGPGLGRQVGRVANGRQEEQERGGNPKHRAEYDLPICSTFTNRFLLLSISYFLLSYTL